MRGVPSPARAAGSARSEPGSARSLRGSPAAPPRLRRGAGGGNPFFPPPRPAARTPRPSAWALHQLRRHLPSCSSSSPHTHTLSPSLLPATPQQSAFAACAAPEKGGVRLFFFPAPFYFYFFFFFSPERTFRRSSRGRTGTEQGGWPGGFSRGCFSSCVSTWLGNRDTEPCRDEAAAGTDMAPVPHHGHRLPHLLHLLCRDRDALSR